MKFLLLLLEMSIERVKLCERSLRLLLEVFGGASSCLSTWFGLYCTEKNNFSSDIKLRSSRFS